MVTHNSLAKTQKYFNNFTALAQKSLQNLKISPPSQAPFGKTNPTQRKKRSVWISFPID